MANTANRYFNVGWQDISGRDVNGGNLFTTPQTNTVLVAAPGVGKRIIVMYFECSVGVVAQTECQFTLRNDGTEAKGCTKFFRGPGGGAFDGVNYICDPNTALTITTNITGNHDVYCQFTIL